MTLVRAWSCIVSASVLLLLPALGAAQPVLPAHADAAPEEGALRVATLGELQDADSLKRLEEILFRHELVHFAYDSPALTPAARRILTRKAAFLQAHPAAEVVIEGHCDARGNGEYNMDLGLMRAESVKLFLVGRGVAAQRIRIVSFGKERPLVPPEGEAAHALNRRAETVPR